MGQPTRAAQMGALVVRHLRPLSKSTGFPFKHSPFGGLVVVVVHSGHAEHLARGIQMVFCPSVMPDPVVTLGFLDGLSRRHNVDCLGSLS